MKSRASIQSDVTRFRNEIAITATKGELSKEVQAELRKFPYIGTTLSGALSIVPVPDDETRAMVACTGHSGAFDPAEVRASAGDTRLGGEDFSRAIAQLFAKQAEGLSAEEREAWLAAQGSKRG